MTVKHPFSWVNIFVSENVCFFFFKYWNGQIVWLVLSQLWEVTPLCQFVLGPVVLRSCLLVTVNNSPVRSVRENTGPNLLQWVTICLCFNSSLLFIRPQLHGIHWGRMFYLLYKSFRFNFYYIAKGDFWKEVAEFQTFTCILPRMKQK